MARQVGIWAAVSLAVLTAGALATMVPAKSGPFCPTDCLDYPYTDIAGFYLREYLWLYPMALASLAFVALVACLHYPALPGRRVLTAVATGFALLSAAVLSVNYVVQMAVVQPSVVRGEFDGLPLLTQFNPYGVSSPWRTSGTSRWRLRSFS